MFERIQNTFYTEISYHFQNPLEILHVLFDGVSKNYYNHVPNRTLGICTWFHSSLIQVLFYPLEIQLHIIDCCPKFATRLKCLIRHKSKNIWVTVLLPKWITHKGITLAKGQLGHLYTLFNKLLYQSVPLVTVRSIVSLLTEKLCSKRSL